MGAYIIRRVLVAIPLLLTISLIMFYIIFSLGDPLARLRQNPRTSPEDIARIEKLYGLDRPIYMQYFTWLGNTLRGDWGDSLVTRQAVIPTIRDRLGNTLTLMVTAYVVTLLIAIPIGLISALKQYSWFDHVVTGLSFVGFSLPVFVLGFLFIWLFSIKFKQWGLPSLPSGKMYDVRGERTLVELVKHMVLPVMTLALISAAPLIRYLRASVLEVLGQDYIRTARSKGLWQSLIVRRHALKNAALPLVTLILIQIAFLFSGAVVTESIYAWPGMGLLFIQSATNVD
ncbi:MAG: ABC transporter permease [Chloroflexota bacterium]|nr:ABC transporter permease [Chloroflexota bacterium]